MLPIDEGLLQEEKNSNLDEYHSVIPKLALLYVKLLLTAGVLELGLEAAVWAFRPHVAQSRLGYYHAQHVSYVFSALGSFLDVARAAAVLWLAVGRWERARAAWRSLRDCVCRRRTAAAAVVGSPTTATATTSGSASTAETERL
ncbi:Protein of unknown function [Gryllus bimaculatus]|nr:Protein of unknown function [Gryllus bimaculatus]